jgi:hypothetical protein
VTTRTATGAIYLFNHPDLLPDSGNTPQPPPAPSGISAVAGVGQVTVTFGAVSGATSYRVYYAAGTAVAKTSPRSMAAISPATVTTLSSDTTYAFAVTATDAIGESILSTVITAKPLAPLSITTASLPAGRAHSPYTAGLAAAGGKSPYAFSLAGGALPNGISLSGSTLSGTPTVSGPFNVTVQATDADARTVTKALTLTLAANRAPRVTSTASAKATEGSNFAYTATASDSDGNTLAISFRGLPAFLSVNGTRVQGMPGAADSDSAFWVLVTDGDLKDSLRVVLTITHNNKAPVIDSAVVSASTFAEGDSATFRLVAHDPDLDSLRFFWSLDSGTSQDHKVTARVEDENGASAEHVFTVTVTPVALPPQCLHAPGEVLSSDPFTFGWVKHRDPDLDSATTVFKIEAYRDSALKELFYAKDTLGADLRLNQRISLISGDTYYVRVMARDGKGYSTGYGPARPYFFTVPTVVRPALTPRQAKLRAYRIASRPGTVHTRPERETSVDARGRRRE